MHPASFNMLARLITPYYAYIHGSRKTNDWSIWVAPAERANVLQVYVQRRICLDLERGAIPFFQSKSSHIDKYLIYIINTNYKLYVQIDSVSSRW